MKKRFLALLLSAVMLLSLTVPTWANYSKTEGVATVTTPADLKTALTDNGVTSIVINGDIEISENLTVAKPLKIDDNVTVTVDGTLTNTGRLENCGNLVVKSGGKLVIPDSDSEICYDTNTNADGSQRWKTADNHVMFNSGVLNIETGGELEVSGALQNDGNATINVFGTTKIHASAVGDNTKDGVINGSVKNFGYFNIKGGTLLIEGGYQADEGNGITAHPYSAAFVNIGEFELFYNDDTKTGGRLNIGGLFYNYDKFEVVNGVVALEGKLNNEDGFGIRLHYGSFTIKENSELYNNSEIAINGGSMTVAGYLRNNDRLHLNGGELKILKSAEQNYTLDESQSSGINDKCSVLCNNYLINLNGGAFVVEAGDASTYNALLRNNGTININGSVLDLAGTMDNDAKVYNYNNGTFKVYNSTRIYNHGHLYVNDSATFGSNNWTDEYGCLGNYGNFNSIDWGTITDKTTVLHDDYTYRIWEVNGPQYRNLNEHFYQIKGSDYWGLIVMAGQDYFGGWKNAAEKVEDEKDSLQSFSVVAVNEDENDTTEYIKVGEANGNYDTFTLSYENWGETSLNIMVDDSTDQNENCVRTYDAGTCLNYVGFYTDRHLNSNGNIDEESAMNYDAVLGNSYIFNVGDQLWLMRNDEGFHSDEGIENVNSDNYIFNIYPDGKDGGTAAISSGSNPEDDWYYVALNDAEYLKFRMVERSDGNYDLLVEFLDGADTGFELYGNICGYDVSLNCYKPTVYVEDTPAIKGKTVTVTVKAENFDGMNVAGYQLKLRYNPDELTPVATNPVTSSTYTGITYDTTVSGEITVGFAGNTGKTQITYLQDGELFKITFAVANTDKVDACDDLEISFDDQFEQGVYMIAGNSEKPLSTSLCAGSVQTFMPGDVHRDGTINMMDALRLLRYCVRDIELSDVEYQAALIVDGQDEPSVAGVVKILNKIVKNNPLTYYGSL